MKNCLILFLLELATILCWGIWTSLNHFLVLASGHHYLPVVQLAVSICHFRFFSDLQLFFVSSTGNPYPAVSWWYRGVLVDSEVESHSGELTSNTVTLPRLTRDDLRAEVTCQASNTNSTPPLSATVSVDMTREWVD